jgi:hypothetical protein
MKVLKMNLPTEFDLSDLSRIDIFRNQNYHITIHNLSALTSRRK